MTYQQVHDGELHWHDTDVVYIACCSCGLVHRYRIGIGYKNGVQTVWYRVWRDAKETRRARWSEKIYADVERRVRKKAKRGRDAGKR